MRALIVALSVLLLPACSTVKLAYGNLDTLARWAADDAVDFSGDQARLFDTEFAPLWHWHRSTQLALYATDLRLLAEEAAQPMSAEQIERHVLRANTHIETLFEAAMPRLARLAATLDEAQVESLLDEAVEQSGRKTRKRLELKPAQRAREHEKEMRSSLKDWIGSLNDEQEARVAAWAQTLQVQPEQWQDHQQRWLPALRALLAQREEPDFESRLRAYYTSRDARRDAAFKRSLRNDRAQWFALMSDLSVMLSEKQRARLQNRLRDYADDFDELAAQTQPVDSDGQSVQ